MTAAQIESTFKDVPTSEAPKGEHNLVEFLVDLTKIEPSRRQAREDIKNGAIRIKGVQVKDVDYMISKEDSFEDRFIIIRKGKKKYFLVNLV